MLTVSKSLAHRDPDFTTFVRPSVRLFAPEMSSDMKAIVSIVAPSRIIKMCTTGDEGRTVAIKVMTVYAIDYGHQMVADCVLLLGSLEIANHRLSNCAGLESL